MIGKVVEKSKRLAPYAIHLAMVIAVAIYVVAGALAIREIEAFPRHDPETSRPKREAHEIRHSASNRTRKCVLAALQRLGAVSNCTTTHHFDSTQLSWLDECYRHDHRGVAQTSAERREEEHNAKAKSETEGDEYIYWTLMDSVLFCYTVITTIGYGNVAPRTFNGRIFVILYGLVGVPFTMLAIANLGKFLATVLKSWTRPFVKCVRRLRRRLCKPKYTAKEKQRLMERESRKSVKPKSVDDDGSSDTDDELDEDEDATSDGIVLFISFVIYIVIGSIAIAAYEPNMDFFEAIYFNFVTLTTIGLGDLVPQSDTYLVITLVYCTVGLALTTIAIEIAADTLKKLHYFGRKMENVANVQVWFGGKKISMKALVKNLGDQFNVPIDELETLNLEQFVDNAMKVEQGELATLRVDKGWMKSNYWQAIESGTMHYVDDDDLVTLQSNQDSRHRLLNLPSSRSESPELYISEYAHFLPSPDTAPSVHLSPGLVEEYLKAVEVQRPALRFLEPPESGRSKGSSYDGKWSEEAIKRYKEYKKTWNKYRITKKKSTEDDDLQ